MIHYQKLERLNSLKTQITTLLQEEEELLTPQRKDVDNIDKLYSHYNRIVNELPAEFPRPDERAKRRMFVFIALYLYSPGALAGRYMERRIRAFLMKLLNLKSKTAINYYCDGLMVWYNNYSDFRNLINFIFTKLVAVMNVDDVL